MELSANTALVKAGPFTEGRVSSDKQTNQVIVKQRVLTNVPDGKSMVEDTEPDSFTGGGASATH